MAVANTMTTGPGNSDIHFQGQPLQQFAQEQRANRTGKRYEFGSPNIAVAANYRRFVFAILDVFVPSRAAMGSPVATQKLSLCRSVQQQARKSSSHAAATAEVAKSAPPPPPPPPHARRQTSLKWIGLSSRAFNHYATTALVKYRRLVTPNMRQVLVTNGLRSFATTLDVV